MIIFGGALGRKVGQWSIFAQHYWASNAMRRKSFFTRDAAGVRRFYTRGQIDNQNEPTSAARLTHDKKAAAK